MDNKEHYICAPDVLFQEVSGELVLLDITSETYFGLNEVGARVWSLLQENLGTEGIVEALLAEYDVESDVLRADVKQLLDELIQAGLIRVRE